jgi:hypothetical protein
MTDTVGIGPSVWLAKDATPLRPYFVRLDGNRAGFGALAPGQWVVVADAPGALNRVGRVLRIRAELEATTLCFDRLHTLKEFRSLADIGLTLPTGLVTRLRPEDLTAVLACDGVSSPDDVPLIQDPAYMRELLELATRDDLLGPANGPDELIVDMSVRDRYLVGKLAPRRWAIASTGTDVEPAAATDEDVDSDETTKAPLHEPGAEFNRATGRVEPEDDAADDADSMNNQSLVPSSVGFTFCVGPDVDAVDVTARWGAYERVPSEEHSYTRTRKKYAKDANGKRIVVGEEQIKVRVWRRTPRGGRVTLPLRDGRIEPVVPDARQDQVSLHGAVRTNATGERLVTLFLVNGQIELEENRDAAWVFQPEILVTGSGSRAGTPVFVRRPRNDVVVDDEERDHLELLYRRRMEFGVGHGVAVHAEVSQDHPARATEVRTEVIPRHEVPFTETPGFDPDDRPAMKTMIERGWLDMRSLADIDEGELAEALNTLVDDYAAWIESQRARIGTEVVGYDEPAKQALERCTTTLARLRAGLRVLLADPNALEAFRFANRAMAQQRVRGVYALQRRRGNEPTLESLDVRKNRSWRPFQLAFLLLSIPPLADPSHIRIARVPPMEAFMRICCGSPPAVARPRPTWGSRRSRWRSAACKAVGRSTTARAVWR